MCLYLKMKTKTIYMLKKKKKKKKQNGFGPIKAIYVYVKEHEI